MKNLTSQPSSKAASWLKLRLPTGLAGAAFWLGIWFCSLFGRRWIPGGFGSFLGILQIFVGIALVFVTLPLIWRLVRERMLWSLRNKLILTYLLIGLAPAILFVTLVFITAYIAAGQFAIHLADSRLQAELTQMRGENERRADLITRAYQTVSRSQTPAMIPGVTDAEIASSLDLPRLKLHRDTIAFIDGAAVPINFGPRGKLPPGLPPWATELADGNFSGIVLDGSDLYLVTIHQRKWNDGRIFTLMNSLPLDSAVLKIVAEGLGQASLLPEQANAETNDAKQRSSPPQISQPQTTAPAPSPSAPQEDRIAIGPTVVSGRSWIVGGVEPPPVNLADVRVSFTSTESIIDWGTGEHKNILIAVESRPSVLYNQLFGSSLSGIITSVLRIALIVLFILFVVIWLLALWMAIRLSRTITTSVHDLYNATQHIDRGDLGHRIRVTRDDQLAELSSSFNTMTGSLQRLLVEQKEKERLQNEISIAQEVQANLFPLHARGIANLDLHGVCRPARSVSGDYYDFLVFHEEAHNGTASRKETGVGIAIGDISGKGISAALLMATLHSAVRAYRFASEELVYSESTLAGLMASREGRGGDCDELFHSPGRILSLLNRHLYRSTQPEKYATLFLAHYDVASTRLTYSNAGQLPPLVLSKDGSIRRLDQGGTVVGLIDGMHYDEDTFHMQSGDILVAYSDGVTEPENDFGEFGEERMMEVVSRYRDQPLHVISTQVMLALDAWIGAEEQPDDITLVLARQS
jgi:sigma-B regulation protein RsbU (phosphoserine phosphatase)